MESEEPRFTHDCSRCIFLGRWQHYDLYYCAQMFGETDRLPTVIARYGHSGPDYASGLAIAHVLPQLAEAKRRATERGLVKEDA
jgi:hypothetical protein